MFFLQNKLVNCECGEMKQAKTKRSVNSFAAIIVYDTVLGPSLGSMSEQVCKRKTPLFYKERVFQRIFFKEKSCKIPSQTPHDDDTKEGA